MKITKFGHCCLLVEVGELRVLTDPGNYNVTPDVEKIDVILITHEHADHVHIESLKAILAKNPEAEVVSHASVGKILDEVGIVYTCIADGGGEIMVKNIPIEGFGTEHACIHTDLPKIQNMGFLIAQSFFYPGDSFYNPMRDITLLALPVAGPWMRLEEAIEYTKLIKPKVVFPVHDGMLRQDVGLGPTRRIPTLLLEPLGIKYIDMIEGSVQDFSSMI